VRAKYPGEARRDAACREPRSGRHEGIFCGLLAAGVARGAIL
jgi:hypothetical protein